jgi:hypothetical protein
MSWYHFYTRTMLSLDITNSCYYAVGDQGSLKKNMNTFMVVILHIPEMCVIMCSCLYAMCKGENILRDLGEFGQEII